MKVPTAQAAPSFRLNWFAGRPRRRQWHLLLALAIPVVLLLPLVCLWLRPSVAHWTYRPQEGDVVFQSLPLNPLVAAIEGATQSPYSHCGLVARRGRAWVVIEAYEGVQETPLGAWLARGRGGEFAAFRFRPEHQPHVPAIVAAARQMLGRPYDARYRWDDEAIYCSELVSKAYEQTTGRPLGRRERFGELRWQPYRETIERIEGGAPPLERELVTPRGLAEADELRAVRRFGI